MSTAYTSAGMLAELQTNTYASMLSPRNIPAILAALNTVNPVITITQPTLTKDEFLLATAPVLLKFSTITDQAKQFQWTQINNAINALNGPIPLTDPRVMAIVAEAIADGLMTEQQAALIGQRPGSQAEHLWGAGFVAIWDQVEGMLNNNGM